MTHDDAPDAPTLGSLHGVFLGRVLSVDDRDGLSRLQVRLLTTPTAVGDGDCAVWARVAVPFAGSARGAFLLPDVDDEVVVQFVNGDPRQAIVMGGVWSGNARAPETLGGDGRRIDRWTLTGRKGTRIAMVEESDGEATVRLSTPGGVSATLRQTNGGEIELLASGHTITVDAQGVSVQTSGTVSVQASQVEVNAPQVTVNAAISSFSGMVRCDTLQTTTCIAATYTPGAGNVW